MLSHCIQAELFAGSPPFQVKLNFARPLVAGFIGQMNGLYLACMRLCSQDNTVCNVQVHFSILSLSQVPSSKAAETLCKHLSQAEEPQFSFFKAGVTCKTPQVPPAHLLSLSPSLLIGCQRVRTPSGMLIGLLGCADLLLPALAALWKEEPPSLQAGCSMTSDNIPMPCLLDRTAGRWCKGCPKGPRPCAIN